MYEEEYHCSQWPIFVGYTSEPETSAVGASWGVFYKLLEETLNSKCTKIPVILPAVASTIGEKEDDIKELKILEEKDAIGISIRDFYAAVTEQYYKVEPFVYHVNMELSESERLAQSFMKFGVLGTAHGVNSLTLESDIHTFFLA